MIKYCVNKEVIYETIEEQVLLINPKYAKMCIFERSALKIWLFLCERDCASFEEIIIHLETIYGKLTQTQLNEVYQFVRLLTEKEIICEV